MTIGQRIAQKRKELSLSQEALGEMLGVSRQSIYKWESDAALPEIDKLIALSKLFGVSVGWLLGVEEDAAPEVEQEENSAPNNDGELSEAQLKMVEEIVGRYLDAQPKPAPRKKWPWLLAGLAVLLVSFRLIDRLDQIDQQYQRVQMTVSNVQDTVNSQVTNISDRVEEILKAQNNLTAEYGTELKSVDPAANQATFSVYAVPKTYIDGMTVTFSVDNEPGDTQSAVGEKGLNQKFSTAITCELTDRMAISAIFIYPDGTRQTQLLDTYEGLFSASFPELDVNAMYLFSEDVVDSSFDFSGQFVTVRENDASKVFGSGAAPTVAKVQLGVFRNQRLLGWATACEQPSHFHGDYTNQQFYRLPDLTVENLTAADKLYVAALVTDSYGRQFMASSIPFVVETDTDRDHAYLTYPSDGRYDPNPENWIFS